MRKDAKDQRPKTKDRSPMSSLNQFTMVQLTIDNAEECQIPNPQSHITNRQAQPRVPVVPSVPFVPFVPFVPVVRDVHGVFANARCPKKTENAQLRKSECGMRMRKPARQQGLIIQCDIPNLEFGITNSRTKPVLETFYHPVRRSGVHPSYSRRGALGIPNLESGITNSRTKPVFAAFYHPVRRSGGGASAPRADPRGRRRRDRPSLRRDPARQNKRGPRTPREPKK